MQVTQPSVFKSPIDGVTKGRAPVYLCQLIGFSVRKVAEICNISWGSVCKIAKEKVLKRSIHKTIFKRGPARSKLSERQQRLLIRAIRVLRIREGNFTCKTQGAEKPNLAFSNIKIFNLYCGTCLRRRVFFTCLSLFDCGSFVYATVKPSGYRVVV